MDKEMYQSISVYMNSIKHFNVLTEEEEKQLGVELLKINNVDKLLLNGKNLDINYVLICLNNIKANEEIKDILIKYYSQENNVDAKIDIKAMLNNNEIYLSDKKIIKTKNALTKSIKNYIDYKNALSKLVCSNYKLIVSIAKKLALYTDVLELISEGNIALIKAAENFDPKLGYKFSTYAYICVVGNLKRYIIKSQNKYGMGIDNFTNLIKIKKEVNKYQLLNNRELSNQEISDMFNVKLEDLDYLNNSTISLDYNEESPLINTLKSCDNIDEKLIKDDMKTELLKYMDSLNEMELNVIKLHYGFLNKVYSIPEIAKRLNINESVVKKHLRHGLKKLELLINADKNKDLIRSYKYN